MKNNTQTPKELLAKAIAAMPDDFALADARTAMRKALTIIEMVENRRERRAANENQQLAAAEKWKQDMAVGSMTSQWQLDQKTGSLGNPFDARMAKRAVQNLDTMIAAEAKKLQMLENKIKSKSDATPIKRHNNEDVGTIFG